LAVRWHEDLISGRIKCADPVTQQEKDKRAKEDLEVAGKFNPFPVRGSSLPRDQWFHNGACTIAQAHPYRMVSGHKKEVIISHEQCTPRGRLVRRGESQVLSYWGFWVRNEAIV